MIKYLARRVAQSIVVLFGVTLVVFLLIHLVPGDPVRVALGSQYNPATYAALRKSAGLDRPLPVQYLTYLGHAVTGNFGVSFSDGQPVTQALLQRLPATASLTIVGLLIGIVIAVPVGVTAAVRRDTWVDSAARVLSQVGVSVPDFVVGLLLILLLGGVVDWLPPSGYVPITSSLVGWSRHVAMPGLAIGLVVASVLTRFIRSAVLDELNQDYVRTARGKGLSPIAIMRRHVMRNALTIIVTVVGVLFASLLGGVIVVEVLFSWPGIGLLTYQAIENRDYAVLQGAVLFTALIFLIVNLAVDILHAAIDPRIRRG